MATENDKPIIEGEVVNEEEVVETPEEPEGSVKTNEDGNIVIDDLTKTQSDAILNQMDGMVFKVGDAFFKVVYQNLGQRRFTASMINDIKG